ncbi:hypothetical protein [Roseovarius dicentrarchi]|uniref:HTH-like domain-containing protein n=1 Tax=Roseovarius dicentrarchi TaxID=2250573 RepID=UPI0013967147|nr:hypothetical protein [Roseovarius dicentrarchi]
MTHSQLVQKLREMLNAHGGKAYPAVHLFGIAHAEEMQGHSIPVLCEDVGISRNYAQEFSKGRKLAPFVTLT